MFGKILIINGSKAKSKELETKLLNQYYEPFKTVNKSAISEIKSLKPDLIILNVNSISSVTVKLCEEIKTNPEMFSIPVIITCRDSNHKVKAIISGADEVITPGQQNKLMFAKINSLMRIKMMTEQWRIKEEASEHTTLLPNQLEEYFGKKCKYSKIMILGKKNKELELLTKPLREKGYRVLYTKSLIDAETLSEHKGFDLFIITSSIGMDKALKFCAKLKIHERSKNTPIMIIGENRNKELTKILETGCNEYMCCPNGDFNKDEYIARAYNQLKKNKYQHRLEKNYHKSLSMASTDDLTGIANRRYLHSYLDNLFDKLNNNPQQVAVLMIDIDDFKDVNDTYGHLAGDEVLVEFATRLKEGFRDFDLIARYGGDEFIAIIQHVNREEALEIANRVQITIASKPFSISTKPKKLSLNISVGLSVDNSAILTPEKIIETADQSLYEAKKAGRGRVCISSIK